MQRLGTAPYLRSTYGLGITTGSRYARRTTRVWQRNTTRRTEQMTRYTRSSQMRWGESRGQPSESTTVRRRGRV
jgi:hypothetical protein